MDTAAKLQRKVEMAKFLRYYFANSQTFCYFCYLIVQKQFAGGKK